MQVHNIKRRIMGSLMAVLMGTSTILGTCPAPLFAANVSAKAEVEVTSDASEVNANQYGLVSAKQGNILHAWDWKFTDVTKNIEDIAEAGYSLVQVSPCQVCENTTTNNDWWKLYQPYDYKFGNSLGTADEFKEMCSTAEKYGVSIIVDVVANHMAGTGTGSCGERKSQVDSWWTDDKFHNTGVKFTGDYDDNREMMVRSNIGMPDVATEREDVQQRMISYLETLLDMGADGFRYDAAKHIGTTSDSGNSNDTFWKNISAAVSAKKPDALVYGEILNSMPVSDEYYVKDGIKVTESQKGWDMKDLVRGEGTVSQKSAFTYTRKSSASNLITWVENHDTYLNHWGSTGLADNHNHKNYMSDDQIMLAWSTVAARADAQALYFARPDGCSEPANPNDNDASNTIQGNLGMSTKNFDWKDKKVASVNKFKNAMVGEGEECSTSGNLAIIKRGNKGVVVTNFGSGSANFDVSGLSGLKDGKYTDASGQNGEFTVSGGKVSGSVKGNSFVVLYDADSVVQVTETPSATPDETPVAGAASVSFENGGGKFKEAVKETITVKNAEYAYYSYDGADWTEIKDGKATVTIGADAKNIGDTYALYVKAMGKDGKLVDSEKTYTYSTSSSETGTTHSLKLRIAKSEQATAPYVYFKGSTTAWPGEAMTEEGDYWVYVSDTMTSGEVIFNGGTGSWQDPEKDKGWHTVAGYMQYSLKDKAVTEFSETTEATVSPDAKKANKAPEFVISTTKPTETPATQTEEPTEAPTATPDNVTGEMSISVNKVDGTQFDTETLPVTIKVENATDAVYSIDGGAEVSFDGETTVEVGEGKIADTDVTLKVTATDKEGTRSATTYTYKKVFNPKKAAEEQKVGTVTTAVTKIKSLMEVVSDAAQADAAGEPTASYYATNPNKQTGVKKTITKASDFTEDMIIAQGVANDDPAIFRGSHEAPKFDLYAMYGAYDDENLYIGIQYTNVIDVVDPAQQAPQTGRGKPNGADADIPQMLVFDTRSGNYTDGTTNDTKQTTTWDTNVKFAGDAKVDKVYMYSPKDGIVNQALFSVADGKVDYNTVVKSGYQGTALPGTSITWEDGFFGSHMYGIKDNGYSGYTPADITDSNTKWVDFLTESSHKTENDTFCILTIPMNLLGTSAQNVADNGIGVMAITTYGSSGMGSLPMDMTMLDAATEPYSKDDSTSGEKEDEDTVTVSLAQLGGVYDGPSHTISPRVTPTATDGVTTATPEATDNVATATPEATDSVATATPEATNNVATATPEVTPNVTATPIVPEDTDQMVVNFGAEKAAPQVAGTTLKLEAKPYNTTGTCQYQFAVDGQVVQEYSESTSYNWYATSGKHTISVSVKDETGKYVVVEKNYTVMGDNPATQGPTATPEVTPNVTATPVQSPTIEDPKETEAPVEITVKASFGKASPQKVNTAIKITPRVSGTKNSYKYSVMAELKNSTYTQRVASNSTAKSVTWKPKKAGTYKITISVTDSEGYKGVKTYNYVIKQPKLTVKGSISKKSIKLGQKVKITASGTASKGTLKFKITSKKKGDKKTVVLKKYSTKKTCTWKPKKKGTYTITVYAKDGSGKQVKKTLKLTVKAKK